VTCGADEAPAVLWVADDPAARGRWAVFDLAPASGYAGAVVVEDPPVRVVTRRWA
jgi:hypothetical protein